MQGCWMLVACVLCFSNRVTAFSSCPQFCNLRCEMVPALACDAKNAYCCGTPDNTTCCVHYFEELRTLANLQLQSDLLQQWKNDSGYLQGSSNLTEAQLCTEGCRKGVFALPSTDNGAMTSQLTTTSCHVMVALLLLSVTSSIAS